MITGYADKSFTFIMKTPPASVLIKKAIELEKGSGTPHTDKVGKITRAQLEEIAKIKQPDLTAADLDAAVRTIAGSARWMGVDVEGVNNGQESPKRRRRSNGKVDSQASCIRSTTR